MGLEVATYVSDLVSSNPLAGDVRAQGDDHIRLMKSVLQSTFPNAARAFRFPATLGEQSSSYTVLAADDGKVIPVLADTLPVTITLPAAASIEDGFYVYVMKTDSTVNAVTLDGNGSDTINGAATQTLTMQFESMLLWWSEAASEWIGFRMRAPTRNLNISGQNLDSVTVAGDYDGTGLTNAPASGWWHVQCYVSSQDTSNILQVATDLDTDNGATYFRQKVGGTWSSWRKFVLESIANAFTGNNTFAGTSSLSKQAYFNRATLTDATNISWNLETAQVAIVTLGGNRTLDAPTNMQAGGTYILFVVQDATGSRTMSFATEYKFPGGNDPVLSTGAGAIDIISFVSDGASMYGVAQKAFA